MLELLGRVYEESGDKTTAAIHYGRAVEVLVEHPDPDNPTLPIELFEKIKEIAPSSPIVEKLTVLLQAGQAASAALASAAAAPAAETPAPVAPVQEQLGEQELLIRYELGVAYKDMGLYDEAIEEFHVALKGPACVVNAAHAVALCLKAQGKTKDAIGYLERALADPGCVGDVANAVRYDLGLLYESDGQFEKAFKMFSAIPAYKDVSRRLEWSKNGSEAGR